MNNAELAYQTDKIAVKGELNFTTVVQLWHDSLPKLSSYTALCFDLADVTSSNSAGVALIVEWMKYAEREGKSICFQHIPAKLQSILAVSGVASFV